MDSRRTASPGSTADRRHARIAWRQERQYATAYHWSYADNRLLEYRLRTEVVLDLLALPEAPRARVLDVGCGDGRFLAELGRRADAWGVDLSRRALGHARARVAHARLVGCQAHALPFADASFDAVTLLDVIEHVRDEREAEVMREALRVLRPGGTLVVSTNTDVTPVERKHYRHYSLARFRALFDGACAPPRLVGLVPHFPTLRFWMHAPLVWRWFSGRVRTCPPETAQVIVGAARRL